MGERRKLTFAQRGMLRRLAENEHASLVIKTFDCGFHEEPTFRGHFYFAPCPTCGHAKRERADWRVIFALAEGEFVKKKLSGTSWFSEITPAGRAALASEPDSGRRR